MMRCCRDVSARYLVLSGDLAGWDPETDHVASLFQRD